MTNSILSWDDLEDDQPIKSAVNQDIALKAAASLQQLDTTEAEKELATQAIAYEKQKDLKASGLVPELASEQPLLHPGAIFTPQQLKGTNAKMLERAQRVIAEMDAHLESGGRVNVAEKWLLNCQADLNQLVPFKYRDPWLLYLSSCENHWMPAELGLEKAAEVMKGINKGTPHKFLIRLYRSYQYRAVMFKDIALLNFYRLITNPECRQYILRQAFESCAIRHVMSDVEDFFECSNKIIYDKNGKPIYLTKAVDASDADIFKERARTFMKVTAGIEDFRLTTDSRELTRDFLEKLIYVYGYVNWTYQIVPIYQLMNMVRRESGLNGLNSMCLNLLRDMQAQTKFITFFMQNAFMENPFVLTPEFAARVQNTFKKFHDQEWDLASTLANTDTESTEAVQLCQYYMTKFLSDIGIGQVKPIDKNVDGQWFIDIVDLLQPNMHIDATIGGNGGSLGEW